MHRSPYLGTQIRSPQLTGSSDLAVARVVAVAWCLACSMICGTALATAQDPPVGEVTACYDDGTFDFSADTAALRIASA